MFDTKFCTQVCTLTEQYIREIMLQAKGIDPKILDAYLKPNHAHGELNFNRIYEHFLLHAMNKGNGKGTLEKVFGSGWAQDEKKQQQWDLFGKFLFGFDPAEVRKEYKSIYDLFPKMKGAPFNQAKPNTFVYTYCLTILDAAQFLMAKCETQDAAEFYFWIDQNYDSEAGRDTTVSEIQDKISGFGPALARDVVKELGYVKFVKPDVHVNAICTGLGIVQPNEKVEKIAARLTGIADGAGITPYALDRMFWLIGSSDFSRHFDEYKNLSGLRKKQKAEARRKDFLRYLKQNGIPVQSLT